MRFPVRSYYWLDIILTLAALVAIGAFFVLIGFAWEYRSIGLFAAILAAYSSGGVIVYAALTKEIRDS